MTLDFLKSAFLLLLLSAGFPNETKAQESEVLIRMDTTCFILGTLSEYMGRFQYVDKKNQIDKYFPYERPMMKYLTSLMKSHFKTKPATKKLNTFSKGIAVVLNSYFDRDGLLVDSLFDTPEKALSYLTGRYYRYGERIGGSIFKIQMSNSPNIRTCGYLLTRSDCTPIRFKHLNNIPAQFIYYFKATDSLKLYFGLIAKQKECLDDSFDEFMKTMVGAENFNNRKIALEKENLEIVNALDE